MNRQEKALDQVVKYLGENPAELAAVKADPVANLPKAAKASGAIGGVIPDNPLYRAVIWFLGLTMLAVVGGAILLVALSKEPPDVIVAIGSAAVGALAGLLAPSPSQQSD